MNHLTSAEPASESCTSESAVWAESIVLDYERIEVSEHPLFAELSERPVDLGVIWVLMANLAAGISRDFVIWLAQTIARVDDRRIASLLAKQLNDELGDGSFSRIHSGLLDRFIAALAPYRPIQATSQSVLEPGRSLSRRASQLFASSSVYEAVGALMVGEIFAKKMDHCVGDQIRRQSAISDADLTWLVIHETLEVDHAEDSLELAALVPHDESALLACQRGARAQWGILWAFLDDVHAVALRHASS